MWNNFCRNTAIHILDKLEVDKLTEEKIELVENVLGSTLILKSIKANEQLSANEKACLLLLAHGRTIHEISYLLEKNEKTVLNCLINILKKTKARNLLDIVFNNDNTDIDILSM